MSNNPPFAVLELNEDEHKYLVKLLALSNRQSFKALQEIAGMSSKDPRAADRSSLIFGCSADIDITASFLDKLEKAKEPI